MSDGLVIKAGLSHFVSNIATNSSNINPNSNGNYKPRIGKVFAVTTTRNTPTADQFLRAGQFDGVGTVFYKDYDQSKDEIGQITDGFLKGCNIAKPLFPNTSYYPLIGELVYIVGLSSPNSQDKEAAHQDYYISAVNLWNNPQVNAQTPTPNISLGRTFVESPYIRNLLSFEGDHIIQGRKGNSIRFGTTVRPLSYLNEWSDRGNDGDPITIISNGHNYLELEYYVERINEEASSIYLTTSQRIPLEVSKTDINNFTKTQPVNEYNAGSQVIINADRVVLNSRKNDLMLFAKNNIEISTSNIINLNADNYIHFNVKAEPTSKDMTFTIPKIYLGTKSNGDLPDEPLLLGFETQRLLTTIVEIMASLGAKLSSATASQEGSPLAGINSAGETLYKRASGLYDKLDKIISKSNFTV